MTDTENREKEFGMDGERSSRFDRLNEYVYRIQQEIGATAAAVYIIQKDKVVNEWYSGRHSASPTARRVDEASQFNVASVRKTYLALAISLMMEKGLIGGIDDEIIIYLRDCGESAEGVTLRHLLTHTHGLVWKDGMLAKEFKAGEGWAYRNTGIDLLFRLVHVLTGMTLSEWLEQELFIPYRFDETGWRTKPHEHMIYNYYENDPNWVGPNDSPAGDQSNLFVSARELAKWGYLHLKRGRLTGVQAIPEAVFARVVEHQSPPAHAQEEPRQGMIWWLQHHTPLNQLGERLPSDSYQVLGLTGCACLVIPRYDAVVVRMYNQLANEAGYDYLSDIREFGNFAGHLLAEG
ncbi:CubicO group peptidase (beta-lactamase class C family) [Paenibacillus harenae]|nr:CubicO group peptidase (beta-lactamase class C family) [Paenibacillus harenae]